MKIEKTSILLFLLLLPVFCEEDYHLTPEEIDQEVAKKSITYGATVRMVHLMSTYHLHSHDVKYGSGSGQQSVTGMQANNDYNSLWTFKEGHNQPMKHHMDPVLCGDVIRLEHALTKKNLHTHYVRSPLSNKQEISCFGNDGEGDTGDNWVLICEKLEPGTPLKAFNVFHLQHHETKSYLFTALEYQFNQRNCGNCPIQGQLEISGEQDRSSRTKWKVVSGFFYVNSERDKPAETSDDEGEDREL